MRKGVEGTVYELSVLDGKWLLLTVLECDICSPLDELGLKYGELVHHILNGLIVEQTFQSDSAKRLNDRLE
jgi:hypothetical protein